MICNKLVALVVLVLMELCAAAEDKTEKLQTGDKSPVKKAVFKDCVESYSVTCLKLDIVSWLDKLDENEDLAVLPGISVVKENTSGTVTSGEVLADLGREFPADPVARLDAYVMKKISEYLSSHSVKLNFWSQGKQEARGGGGGGFGGGKHGGGMGYLLAAGAMMKGTLMALAMGGLAALAGKALMAAMMSLMMSGIIGLKSLSHSGGHKQTTYEVITKPVVSHHNTHSVSHEHAGHYDHYGRSFETAPLPLGLQPDYKPSNAL